ncbi:MAG: phenylalanine--tRNA ligase subunit alpha [Clostridiales bacterium]|jgi:phenylalanyl-tRNA synthetase alpha chain|nr:phenylalanine--tRNA ligase subunit alpha [Clostridiales bacterium]
MKEQLAQIRAAAEQAIVKADSVPELDTLRVRFFGKKGELTSVLKQMGGLSAEMRPVIGQLANETREYIESQIEIARARLEEIALTSRLAAEKIDVTIPGTPQPLGHKHPMSIVLDEALSIFVGMGYKVVEGPEVEYDYYNFEALNIPRDHPARDTQDTFYITDNVLLRTQTSSVQIRHMEKNKPPIKIVSPGRVFRSDEIDATHSPLFHQIEGLVVDKGVTMGDLKGTLEVFAKRLYGEQARARFRPHHFQFTEPSAEMDIMCFNCQGKGCRLCKNEGWIEVLGAGLVHPKVLEICGIDPDVYSGFAFGIGLERITMRRYGIKDIRLFYENDLRFLKQFQGVM